MQLSIVILNYNVRYFLELCLKSVEAAILNLNAEIIVVDNNSTDDSCKMVKQLFPQVKLIENKTNYGFSKGNNIGVAKAIGEYICILNPDTVVAEDTFVKVLEFSKSKSNIGIIGCQLIDGKGQFLPESKRQVPTPKVAFKKMLGFSKSYYNNRLDRDSVGKTDILVGAFMFLKKDIYNQVSGFDEDYFMYGEDIDLSFKIIKAGYNNYYYGGATVIHFKGESTLKNRVYAERFYGAMNIFYRKHFKKNSIFSALVGLGIRLASKTYQLKDKQVVKCLQSVIVSQKKLDTLLPKLQQPVLYSVDKTKVFKNTLVVLDAHYIGYGSIIDYIKFNSDISSNSYRILPENSTFILGSDTSVGRGEVISF